MEFARLATSSFGAAAIAMIYVIYGAYRDYLSYQMRRERLLRERVAFMLWTAATHTD